MFEVFAARARATFVRTPLIDPECPDASDVDVLAFTGIEELHPERMDPAPCAAERRTIDVTWVPAAWLDDPDTLAARGLIAHRIVSSEPALGTALEQRVRAAVAQRFYAPELQQQRIAGFMEMASLTVREIGVTWDFPALALFWLHMARTACLAAALDGLRRLCPNVYTRPMSYLEMLSAATGVDFTTEWIAALGLDADPADAIAAVQRVQATVSRRFPEPAWPAAMRETTRREFRYWTHPAETAWRIEVARELTRRGHPAAAVFYVRFLAYALARVPMVHTRAREGRDVAYLRPERAVHPDLSRLCPELLADLSRIFAGARTPTVDAVEQGIEALAAFRERVEHVLRRRGVPVPASSAWLPYRPPPREGKEALCQT